MAELLASFTDRWGIDEWHVSGRIGHNDGIKQSFVAGLQVRQHQILLQIVREIGDFDPPARNLQVDRGHRGWQQTFEPVGASLSFGEGGSLVEAGAVKKIIPDGLFRLGFGHLDLRFGWFNSNLARRQGYRTRAWRNLLSHSDRSSRASLQWIRRHSPAPASAGGSTCSCMPPTRSTSHRTRGRKDASVSATHCGCALDDIRTGTRGWNSRQPPRTVALPHPSVRQWMPARRTGFLATAVPPDNAVRLLAA